MAYTPESSPWGRSPPLSRVAPWSSKKTGRVNTATGPLRPVRKAVRRRLASTAPAVTNSVPAGKQASAAARSSSWQTTRKRSAPARSRAAESHRAAGSNRISSSMREGKSPSRGRNTIAPKDSIKGTSHPIRAYEFFTGFIITNGPRLCTENCKNFSAKMDKKTAPLTKDAVNFTNAGEIRRRPPPCAAAGGADNGTDPPPPAWRRSCRPG